MKHINEHLSGASVNEARQVEYRVAFLGVGDPTNDDLPFGVTILVDKEHQKEFEKFLDAEDGNIFAHAEGGNVEY